MQVRTAIGADYDAYLRLFPELGVDEGTPSRERFDSDLSRRMLVADDGTGVVGYLLYDLMDGTGYVRNIVSDPAHRRAGIGAALMETARDRFAGGGATTWCLNVKASNRPAIGLYEKFGMRLHYRTTMMRLPRETALPAADPAIALVQVPPATDAIVERAFQLLPGQLASARAKAGRTTVQLVRGPEVLGVGVFMAAIPGSFPFRVVAPEYAATFMTLLRPLAVETATFLQVSAENDAALAAQVQQLGAYVHLELLHMHGALA